MDYGHRPEECKSYLHTCAVELLYKRNITQVAMRYVILYITNKLKSTAVQNALCEPALNICMYCNYGYVTA